MKRKKSTKKNLTLFRFLLSSLFLLMLFWGGKEGFSSPEIVSSDQPITLHATQCQDDLRKLFLDAIADAKRSIFVVIYALNDDKLIRALNKRAKEGIEISVYHDPSTSQKGFQRLKSPIQVIPIQVAGLAHQKILITDEEKVWIGSANWTPDSLRVHANLVVGIQSKNLAQIIFHPELYNRLKLNDQNLEFWHSPERGREGLARLLSLIEGAQKTIRVAMYTWTHPELTQAIIHAHKRGVHVEVVMDNSSAQGVSKKAFQALYRGGIAVFASSGYELLHHKFAWIDDHILVHGSTNWTRSAFARNHDCFIVLDPLSNEQVVKMRRLWKAIYATRSLEQNQFLVELAA